MRAFTKLVPILVLLGAGTVIHADSGAPSGGTPPPAKKPLVLTAAEMDSGSAKILAGLEDDTRTVLHLKEAARKMKDVIKLSCVNDRLMQIKAQRNIADTQNQELHTALEKGAVDAQPAYAQLLATSEGVHQLRDEANACVGEPELVKQENGGVEVHHPDLPDDPTAQNPYQDLQVVDVEPPGYASPFF